MNKNEKKHIILCGIHWEDEDGWWVSDEKGAFVIGLGKNISEDEAWLLEKTFDKARG